MNYHLGLAVLVYVYVIQCTVADDADDADDADVLDDMYDTYDTDDTDDTDDTELPVMALDPFRPGCTRCLDGDSAVNITGDFSIGDEALELSMVNLKVDIAAGPASPYKTRGVGVWRLYCAIARTICSKWFVDSYARTRFTYDCNCAPRVGDLYKIWIPIRPLKNFKGTVLRIRYSLQLDPAKDGANVVASSNFSVDSIFDSTAYEAQRPSISSGHKIFAESTKLVLMTGVCSALYLNLFISCS